MLSGRRAFVHSRGHEMAIAVLGAVGGVALISAIARPWYLFHRLSAIFLLAVEGR